MINTGSFTASHLPCEVSRNYSNATCRPRSSVAVPQRTVSIASWLLHGTNYPIQFVTDETRYGFRIRCVNGHRYNRKIVLSEIIMRFCVDDIPPSISSWDWYIYFVTFTHYFSPLARLARPCLHRTSFQD